MSASFRCFNLNSSQTSNSESLTALLERTQNSGFHAFFTHSSWISGMKGLGGQSSKNITTCFAAYLEYTATSIQKSLINPFDANFDNWTPETKILYLIGAGFSEDFSEKILALSQKLRAALSGEKFINKASYALYQASVINLISGRFTQSPLLAGTLGYEEYLLWNDGGLWGKQAWNDRVAELTALGHLTEENARLRLAWLGAGWLSSRLEIRLSDKNEPWYYEPDIEFWAKTAMTDLQQFDTALISYYQKKKSEPPGRKHWNSYIRTLCEFLPFHRSRDNHNVFLPSNSLANKGGPRLWQGFLQDSTTMHTRHLLLDGWLTLWSITETGQPEQLYLQPGSIALLYWAARQADMPHTESPDAFLQNYLWTDPHWFGGQWSYPSVTQLSVPS